MSKIDNRTLSVLSMLMIPGILTFPLLTGGLILIPTAMCAIGGYSLGILIGRK